MELNPDKQLINELQIKLSDCERWLREKDKEIIKLEMKIKELQEEVDTLNAATSDMARELQREREY